jgi:YD repeat-containing protein
MPISYGYDAVGRLVAAIDQNGDAVTYSYDLVGNLLGIAAIPAGTVFVAAVVPTSAQPGDTISIVGGVFPTSGSDISVDLNGLPAVVVSSSRSVVMARVPDGASTGPLRVTTPSGSAVAAVPFAVRNVMLPPVLDDFSPTIGAAGTVVRIRGRGLAGDSGSKAFIGSSVCAMVNQTDTMLEVRVPPGTGSGRLALLTPAGEAVSDADFVIPPLPATADMIEVTARMAVGESRAIALTRAGSIALALFEGAAGTRISIETTDVSIPHASLFVFEPDGMSLMKRANVGAAFTDATEPILLRTSGTYTIQIDPTGPGVGSLTVHLHGVPEDVFGSIEIDGPPATIGTVAPMQRAHLRFDGVAGDTVGVAATDVALANTSDIVQLILENPDGSRTPVILVGASDITASLPTLTQSGEHAIIIDPDGPATVTLTVTLSRPVLAQADLDGASTDVVISRPGQDAHIAFAASAGASVRIAFSTTDFSPTDGLLTAFLLTSDGVFLEGTSITSGERILDVQTLPASTGPFTIRVHPHRATTSGLSVQLSTLPSPA